MTSSDAMAIADLIREGACVLGCRVHYAACGDYGKPRREAVCTGCAPAPAHPGSVICTRCFGRMRHLLREAPDLVARIRSLSDPTKAMQIAAVKVSSRPVEAVAPVGPDLLDAADAILCNLRDWAHHVRTGALPFHSRRAGMDAVTAYRLAVEYSNLLVKHLEQLTSNPATVHDLAEAIMVVHEEDEGERNAWSIADALNRWGAERRDRHVHPDVDTEPDREESARPVREWYDPTLSVKDAAKRAGVDESSIRRWVASGDLPVAMRARGPRGSIMLVLYASQVDRVAAEMKDRRNVGRAGVKDTPGKTSMVE